MNVPSSTGTPARPLVVILIVMLLFSFWQLTGSWNASILDRHEFRQLQTATSAYWMKTDGFRLDYETPIFGPPWSVPMEFPTYQGCVAAVSKSFSWPLEQTARGVSIFFFFATLPAVYSLAGLLQLGPSRRLLILAVVLTSPTYLFYGRSFMIETTALCFAAWFLHAVTRAVRDDSWRWTLAACLFAALAGLTKITTFVVFLPPAALLTWIFWRDRWGNRSQNPTALARATLCALIPPVIGVAVSYVWILHGDHLKDINPFAGFLKSTEMKAWNWGTWDQRTSGEIWRQNWTNFSQYVFGVAPLAVVVFCVAVVKPFFRRVAIWCGIFFLSGPLLFINLYYRHDYYYCANALFLLVGVGFVLAGIWESDRLPLGTKYVALLLIIGGQLGTFYSGYGSNRGRDLRAPPALASIVRELVPPQDVVIIYGWDWYTLMPYYSQRRVIMVPYGRQNDFKVLNELIGSVVPLRVSAMLIRNNEFVAASPAWIRQRCQQLKLSSAPIASSIEGDLYLSENALPAAIERLRGRSYEGVTLHSASPVDPNEGKLKENDIAPLAVSFFRPSPARARSMFGFSVLEEAGQPVVFAHPSSSLYFQPPENAMSIEAVVGLVADAYAASNPSLTDGVTVEIIEERIGGLHRVLYRRDLDPVKEKEDRGPQSIKLADVGPFSGQIVFKINPGPKNNINSDWAYWSRIDIH